MTDSAFAFGLGVGTHNSKGEWLEVFFARPLLAPPAALAEIVAGFQSGAALDKTQLQTLQSALAAAGADSQARLAESAARNGSPRSRRSCWQQIRRLQMYPRATSSCTCCPTAW